MEEIYRSRMTWLIFVSLFFVVSTSDLNAQSNSLGVAIPTEVSYENPENGDVLCLKDIGIIPCQSIYDPSIHGIVTTEPAMAFRHDDDEALPLVLSSGNAIVKVSSINGNIEAGNLVTTSEIPGVAQLADLNGFVIGVALESYESNDPTAVGEIFMSINIHPVASFVGSPSNIVGSLRQAISAPVLSPVATFRYLLAFLIALISFALGFFYFGRVIKTGVEAIGRNPLAKKEIQVVVVVNVIITLSIILTGLGIALAILIL